MRAFRDNAVLFGLLLLAGCDPIWNYVPEGRLANEQTDAWNEPYAVSYSDFKLVINRVHLFSTRLSIDCALMRSARELLVRCVYVVADGRNDRLIKDESFEPTRVDSATHVSLNFRLPEDALPPREITLLLDVQAGAILQTERVTLRRVN